ncbi:MAG: TIGR00341 family protein [Phycisphaerales bacterium]|nr:TIGR00341 family protein [Phycisphaerales bacterium]
MAKRLVEITIPRHHASDLTEVLEQLAPEAFIQLHSPESSLVIQRAVLEAEAVEAVIDPLQSRFAGTEHFQILILPVLAALPREAEPEPQERETEAAPKSHRVSREELYNELAPAAKVTPVYLTMTVLSTVVATIGLSRDSGAIVIGAMVIAPLLGPNMVLALATTTGDRPLATRALKANGIGVATAIVMTLLIGPFVTVDPALPEMHSRTQVAMGDVFLALAAGTAGAVAFTSGVAASLIGVMVAVALLPPLVVTVLLFSKGHTADGAGALLLLATNVICVNLAAVATFAIQGVVPRRWWEKQQTRRDTIKAIIFWVVLLAIAATLIVIGIRDDELLPTP